MRAVLRLKRGAERARVHPWIFKGDVADVSVGEAAAVTVVDSAGQFVGRGFYNPRPALCCRIVTWRDEALDGSLWRRRIDRALALRRRAATAATSARLIWSESDGLPGFVADRYGDVLVVQSLTLGMARVRAELVAALRSAIGDVLPVFVSDDPVPAGLEGFEPLREWLDRPGPASVVVEEPAAAGSVRLGVTFGAGHKTGLYLDQGENRRRFGALARGREVLDAFAYTGAFACHALAGGARRAVCVESSPDAVAAARENFAVNGVADRAELVAANAFDELRRRERARERFGLVVLDPPPFARGRAALEAARRGYKEINLRAMRLLEPGGVLATFSCSHHVSADDFADICRAAATDAGVTMRILAGLTQSPDHPILLTVPETHYLKGLLLERVEP
jgi:23S rRNA (cytosine1962-C5)-methyltransferase